MLGERESTSCPRIASHAVQTCRCRLLRLLSGVPRVGYWFFQVMPMLRYNLPYGSLQGALAADRSKTHSAEVAHAWFALHRD